VSRANSNIRRRDSSPSAASATIAASFTLLTITDTPMGENPETREILTEPDE
jgi:hypothetical protein